MGRTNREGARDENIIHHRLRFSDGVRTLGAALTLTNEDAQLQVIDPGGATRVVTLPAVSESDNRGAMFIIVNAADAAEDLTINTPASTTIATISQDEMGIVVCVRIVAGTLRWFGGVLKQT